MPRLLFINNTSELGAGTSRSLLSITRFLRPSYDVTVVLDEVKGQLPAVLKLNEVPCFILPLRTWRYLPALICLIIKGRYDLVYANNFCGRAENAAWAAALTRRPFVWHIRESLTPGSNIRSLPLSRAIVANSGDTASRIVNLLPKLKPKLTTITNGVALEDFEIDQNQAKDFTRKILGIPKDSVVMLNVGFVSERKNQFGALEVAAEVLKRFKALHLVFIGPCREESYLASLKNLVSQIGLQKQVHFLGSQANINSFLCGADLLLHTARKEPQGRVVLEAMAARIPVVAYDVGGIREALIHEQTGLLAPFGDIKTLSEWLKRLITDPQLRQKMGEHGYQHVKANFTAQLSGEKIRQLIDSVLIHSRPNARRSVLALC